VSVAHSLTWRSGLSKVAFCTSSERPNSIALSCAHKKRACWYALGGWMIAGLKEQAEAPRSYLSKLASKNGILREHHHLRFQISIGGASTCPTRVCE
jgi:hypothetical protein